MGQPIACVILAAGAGTRMKSDLPKVLHPVCGQASLEYLLRAAATLKARRTIVVAGHGLDEVRAFVAKRAEVVKQVPPRGTGHALLQAKPALRGFDGWIVVMCGDAPLIRPSTLEKIVSAAVQGRADGILLSFRPKDPKGYGRIVRRTDGTVLEIVEELSASSAQKALQEVNSGVYAFKGSRVFGILEKLSPDPQKNEIYLTDAVGVMAQKGKFLALQCEDPQEAMGINSRKDLAEATAAMKRRILERHMDAGVTIVDPATTFIEEGVGIGRDTVIYPNTVIEGPCEIGRKCQIGPFAHIRPGCRIDDEAVIGNFVEVVRSRVGAKVQVKHLTYLGDASVGEGANIGAGTITANFDGRRKHSTVIGRRARIGSGTIFVAPVRVGDEALTGAGSVLTGGTKVPPRAAVAGIPARLMVKRKKNR